MSDADDAKIRRAEWRAKFPHWPKGVPTPSVSLDDAVGFAGMTRNIGNVMARYRNPR